MNNVQVIDVVKIKDRFKYINKESIIIEFEYNLYLNEKKIHTFMCMKNDLIELAIGYLYNLRFINSMEDVKNIRINNDENKIMITTYGCKKEMIQKNNLQVFLNAEKIIEYMDNLLDFSNVFKTTGAVHSIALANNEKILYICEDVSRHNAMDKIIGRALFSSTSLDDKIALLSCRVSYEMMQKIAYANIRVVISKSAPTSKAIELAKSESITLVGFVRDNCMNVYANEYRIEI